jgi:hypothetical protein
MSDLFELRSEQRSGRSEVPLTSNGMLAAVTPGCLPPSQVLKSLLLGLSSLTSHVALNEEKS